MLVELAEVTRGEAIFGRSLLNLHKGDDAIFGEIAAIVRNRA